MSCDFSESVNRSANDLPAHIPSLFRNTGTHMGLSQYLLLLDDNIVPEILAINNIIVISGPLYAADIMIV